MSNLTRIVGIDPGSRRTGVGIIDARPGYFKHVHHAVVETFDEEFPLRLRDIFVGVRELVLEYKPTECAIETVFLSKNPASALKLGQARGAAICAAVNADLPVHEYAPRAIKLAVVGTGAAEKTQVQYMVAMLLSLPQGSLQADAADGLAVALAHAQTRATLDRFGVFGTRR